jgi:anti-sigma regulatory factor (Ser/Thr protein kinase)
VDQQATLELAPALRAPRTARAFVTETLIPWGARAEDVEAVQLVVSELVTNAVLHASESPTITLELLMADDAVRVVVTDRSPAEPRRMGRPVPWSAESGRGVALVDAFADTVRTETHRRGGKTVWCDVRIRSVARR